MADMKLFNSLTRRKEDFKPLRPAEVGMYVCGPTVYQYAHIGNMRPYVFADLLRRTLEYNGYRVRHVMNITDVGHLISDADEGPDKMVESARREQKSPYEIAAHYTEAFMRDIGRLNVQRPSVVCPATGHIPEMIAMVERLVELGHAYEVDDGIYFDVTTFTGYGRLSRADLGGQLAGARVEVNPQKRNAADFALWKKAEPGHIMQWPSPWGQGYPGWHIECSAMGIKYLGDAFDIHTGGVDHLPIHHENEIAQADACAGHRVVQVWMHVEHVLVDNARMAKSVGNVYMVDDLVARGSDPLALRYLYLVAHYRKKVNFTWDALAAAQAALENVRRAVGEAARENAGEAGAGGTAGEAGATGGGGAATAQLREGFLAAVNDDLNMPRGLAVLWEALRSGELPPTARRDLALEFDRILGLGLAGVAANAAEAAGPGGAAGAGAGARAGGFLSRAELAGGGAPGAASGAADAPQDVLALLRKRHAARAARDWQAADAARDELSQMGIRVEDTPDGVRWRREG